MLYSLKLALIALVTLPLTFVVLLLGPLDRKGKLIHRISLFWTSVILKIGGIRLRIEGANRLNPGRHYIFVANHQSNIDIPVLIQGLASFQLRWTAKKELFFIPIFGWALWMTGQIVVDRSDRARAMASLKRAQERIAQGTSVVIFPEGTRGPEGQLLPFKRGGFLLAIRTRTPIVPIIINGSGAVLPRGDWRIRSGEIEVIVGDPVPIEKYHAGTSEELLGHIRRTMESHLRSHADPSGNSSGEPVETGASAQE